VTPPETRDASLRFVLGFLSLYLVVVLVSVARHELWRDELQVWMVAKHSLSLPHLFVNKVYDAHPSLWYLTVYFVTRFTARPNAAKETSRG
jgi:hypothetical protein